MTKTQIQTMTGDKYAKLEKAKFMLEQEGYELDKILMENKKGKDEIDSLLRNAYTFKNVTSSGANKVLENILRHMKSEEFLFNYDALLKAIGSFSMTFYIFHIIYDLDREFEQILSEDTKTDIIQEITKKIMYKLDSNNKKKLLAERHNIPRMPKEIKEFDFSSIPIDKFTQVF